MKYLLVALVVIFLALMALVLAQPAGAQSQTVPTPPPAPAVNPVDAANAQRDQWESIANSAIAASNSAIAQAQSAIASAQAGIAQAQNAAQQEAAARRAAEQGQIQEATDQAHAASLSALKALDLVNQSLAAAQSSEQSALHSERLTAYLKIQLANRDHQLDRQAQQIAQLSADNSAQAAYLARLQPYTQNIYNEVVVAWVVAGVLGFIVIGMLAALVIIVAAERRNRWPIFKGRMKIDRAIVFPEERPS